MTIGRSLRRFARARSLCWARILVLSAATGAATADARAHAIVVTASPTMGATVAPGKLNVRIDFNSRIDQRRSRLRLRRPDGSDVFVALAPNSESNVLAGTVEVMEVGRWKVVWQVLSLDGHITRGEVTFQVRDKGSTR